MMSKGIVVLLILNAALKGLAQGHYPITGVPVVNQQSFGAPLRMNINDLQARGGPQWDLYILALSALYQDNDENPLSYFQISGIHGLPFIEWNGAGPGVGSDWGGYCPHNENLFLPWHRAYILLFEQVLVEKAKQIAWTYPERFRAQYYAAAETLRAPYWDWAADPGVPPATASQTVRVNYFNGNDLQQLQVENPLWTYRFPQAVLNGKYGAFDAQMRPQTYRCRGPNSYPASANILLSRRPYKQWVYDALTRARDFTEFSLGGGVVSLEQIHNAIHWDGACGEQFLDFALTAFDPLFMLHHTNVDRLWSYWQALRPEWDIFGAPYQGQGRFSTRAGTVITYESPLQPFYDQKGAFHTTLSMRAIWNFGYTYQGLEWWQKSAEQMRQDVTRIVNWLYSPNRPASRLKTRAEPKTTTRYFARLQLDVTQVERPCMVNVYVDGRQAGSLVVMNRPTNGTMQTGFGLDEVAQGHAIQAIVNSKADNPTHSSIEVEIVKPDGSKIPLKAITSLDIEVEAVEVTLPSTELELPTYGASKRYKVPVVERKVEKH